MGLSLVTAPATEPLSLEEARAHLRVDVSDDDALISALIPASRQFVESYTGRKLVTQTWDYQLDGFPCGAIVVPLAPVASVTSITYVGSDGTTQTWSASDYRTDVPAGPWAQRPRIEPAYGLSYPSTRGLLNSVTVRCVAGYGSATAVPEALKAAMKILIGQWYEQREPVVIGQTPFVVPFTIDALLWPFKVF